MRNRPELLTIPATAELLGCSASTVRVMISRGILAAITTGTSTRQRVTMRSIDAALNARPEPVTPRRITYADVRRETRAVMAGEVAR